MGICGIISGDFSTGVGVQARLRTLNTDQYVHGRFKSQQPTISRVKKLSPFSPPYMKQFDHRPYYFMSQRQTELRPLDQQSITRKQGEVDAVRLSLHEANKAKTKKDIIRRLDHIQRLAKQKNYAEIERLLQECYI